MVLAAVAFSGCGDEVESTTCSDVSRSTEKTEALVQKVAEERTLAGEDVRAGLDEFCGQAKPDDKPYAELPHYAEAAFRADVEKVRETFGDDAAEDILRERQEAVDERE